MEQAVSGKCILEQFEAGKGPLSPRLSLSLRYLKPTAAATYPYGLGRTPMAGEDFGALRL